MKKVLILGGAGFIGSNFIKVFYDNGFEVTVIDGFLKQTGASFKHISHYENKIKIISERVEDVSDLTSILGNSDLIVDCMGFTAHHLAIKDPSYDQELNVNSHLAVILALKDVAPKKIIYLGSRGQYGSPQIDSINESTPQIPEDIQGINKVSAESYYRVYSKFFGYNIISLRVPNCFGENQPVHEGDIGLIGKFIFETLNNRIVKVYGAHRKRSILYVGDLAQIVYNLSKIEFNGFLPLNINGLSILISDLALKIINLTNKGKLIIEEMPEEIKNIETGNAMINEGQIIKLIGKVNYTDLNISLGNTINYFKLEI
jgi:nucleoside-diphosphate-sugar epimerase